MIEWLTKKLMLWAEKRGRVLKITGTDGPDDIYLIRYYIVRSRLFNFFVHQFLRSDRDDLHTHPWHFCTYLVKGAYTENKWNPKTNEVDMVRRSNRIVGAGLRIRLHTLVFRRATDQHQVVVDHDLKEYEKDKAALTLCFTGPTICEWGFVRTVPHETYCSSNVGCDDIAHGERVWVPWREYLGLPPDTPGRG